MCKFKGKKTQIDLNHLGEKTKYLGTIKWILFKKAQVFG